MKEKNKSHPVISGSHTGSRIHQRGKREEQEIYKDPILKESQVIKDLSVLINMP
jgi:hypothetical protein